MRLLAVVFAVGGVAFGFIGWGAAISAAVPAPSGRVLVYATPPGVGYGVCRPGCRPDRAWVWRASVEGLKRVRLTHGLAPVVSPDGRRVAFVRARRDGTETEIDVIGSRGGAVRRLMRLTAKEPVYKLIWAPDSRRLVAAFVGRVVSLSPNGEAAILGGADLGQISFSPDGSQLAYVKTVKTLVGHLSDVYVTSLGGGEPRRITSEGDAEAPVWGTDGIAFLRNDGNIWIVQPGGTGLRQLTLGSLWIRPVAWSQDGMRLLGENPPHRNGRLWAVDGRTGAARTITGWVGGLDALGLSRDGRTILATTGHGGFQGCVGRIETIPYAGGRARVLLPQICDASWNG